MNKREDRVINAFINCVNKGEFSLDYAITLIEDSNKYGYLSPEAKERFYSMFEKNDVILEEVEELKEEDINE